MVRLFWPVVLVSMMSGACLMCACALVTERLVFHQQVTLWRALEWVMGSVALACEAFLICELVIDCWRLDERSGVEL